VLTYKDIANSHWAFTAVTRTTFSGLFEGFSDGGFHGERTLTRYELAVVMRRLTKHYDVAYN
jgi:hypothetical protein